jgi:hypothetical protein
MSNIAENLNQLYKLVTEAVSDSEFYQAVHQYCELLETNETLKRIIHFDQLQYSYKHSAIWDDINRTSKQKKEETHRIEKFSMYCDVSSLIVHIYQPIQDYKISNGSDTEQDPAAILMLKGIESFPNKDDKQQVMGLFKSWYKGKRALYEQDLRNFHGKMLNALEQEPKNLQTESSEIFFSPETGDFKIGNVFGSFNPKTQEFSIFQLLFEANGENVPYLKLIHTFEPKAERASKGYKLYVSKLISNIKNKLGDERDCVTNTKLIGYRLVYKGRN